MTSPFVTRLLAGAINTGALSIVAGVAGGAPGGRGVHRRIGGARAWRQRGCGSRRRWRPQSRWQLGVNVGGGAVEVGVFVAVNGGDVGMGVPSTACRMKSVAVASVVKAGSVAVACSAITMRAGSIRLRICGQNQTRARARPTTTAPSST